MFAPSREEVRTFFINSWHKHQSKMVLTPLETMAVDIALMHPEYHGFLEDQDSQNKDFSVEDGQTNPFLHMSMHLAIHEQLSIDQPPGIKAAYTKLTQTRSNHDADHIVMKALGQIIWEVQRSNKPYDGHRYLELILKSC